MFEREFTVRYITLKKCFCYLSQNNLKELQGNLVRLGYGDGLAAFFSLEGASLISIGDGNIGINSLYAKTLGIGDSEVVTVSRIEKLPLIKSLAIIPTSKDDYDVMEMFAENVQSTLLNQVRVLDSGQKLVIWIGTSLNVTVDVCNVKPLSPGRIDNFTEVTVKPPDEGSSMKFSKTDKSSDVTNRGFNSIFNFFRRQESENSIIASSGNLFTKYHSPKELMSRVVPLSSLEDQLKPKLCHNPFNAFIFGENLVKPQIYSATFMNDQDFDLKSIYLMVHYVVDRPNKFNKNVNHIFVSEDVFSHFQCEIGARFLLELHENPPTTVEQIDICTPKKGIDIIDDFKRYLAEGCEKSEFLLNPDFVLQITNKFRAVLKFQGAKFCLVNPDFVRNCKFSVITEPLPISHSHDKKTSIKNEFVTSVSNFTAIIEDSLFELTQNSQKPNNILITGKAGSGKSTLLKAIKQRLVEFPNFYRTITLDCRSLKGKTVESLHKQFTAVLFELIHHQPSVLILDDFDIICENAQEYDALAPNAIHFDKISEMLDGLFHIFTEFNAIGILASAESVSKLNKNIYGTRGSHFFKDITSINSLDKNDRKHVLGHLLSSHITEDLDFEPLAERTESFVFADLVDFVNKSLFESFQSQPDCEVFTVSSSDCEKALQSTSIASLQGIDLNQVGSKDFTDIGGLHEVKTTLIETLLWPSKYPNLFTNTPLRLPSGLLLYGPPGTGKTLLAGAAAKQCTLRLISIKGPELLSKYIGASEQAVRDVFEKAQSARPCVLFFDEFDSLAPRRGHDNTGVTDRVVNQLLTQLDGVESLAGVYTIAATSRPDLLDPALLRPGRLDRHILCPLPDREARLEILISLSKNLEFEEGIDLEKIASSTDGFSGADLQSILYSAQVATVEDLLSASVENEGQRDTSVINQSQLDEALAKTRPSLTNREKLKYERM